MKNLITSTMQARNRTGNKGIGTRIQKGKFQIVSIDYDKHGKSIVNPISDWLDLNSAIEFLDAIK